MLDIKSQYENFIMELSVNQSTSQLMQPLIDRFDASIMSKDVEEAKANKKRQA